ncbi:tyrosine-type recombinase/integrase [Geodermatophilus sp. URMC 65]
MNSPLTFSDALTAYSETRLASRNYARRTRREYLTDLRQLGEYLALVGVTTIDAVQRRHLEGFLAQLDRQVLTNTTRRRKLAVIRSFFQFLEQAGHRTGNPAADVVPPHLDPRQPRYLTQGEYERLRLAARHVPRDAALIELLLQTGLRLSEVAHLRLSDVELPGHREGPECGGSVGVWHGRRQRLVTLNSTACEALRGYLLVRPADAQDDSVFVSKFRRGMGPRSIEDAVNKHLQAAGIRGASVQSLRATFAVHTLRQGTSQKVLQQALGVSRWTAAGYAEQARVEMDRQLQEHAL